MSDAHPQAVFVTENPEVADAVVRLLASQGIPAEVIEPPPDAMPDALPGLGGGSAPLIAHEVRVTDPSQVDKAKQLMESAMAAAAMRDARAKRESRTGTVTAKCEDCGKESDWPATSMGTTETCPYCTSYMDVPDPDEDWSGIDFGDPEDDNG